MEGEAREHAISEAGAGPSRMLSLPERTHETRYLLRSDQPQVVLTWGSRMPAKPDKLKLRKRIEWAPLPIRVNLKADYDTETREFSYGMTCKDTLLGGRFSLNLAQNSIEYRKRFPCPNGMTVSLNGTVRLEDRTVKPTVWAQLEFGSSGSAGDSRATLVHGPTGDSWDVRQRLRVLKGLKFEVCGSTKVPTPAARFSSDHGRLSVGEGAFHLHVAEINAVVSL